MEQRPYQPPAVVSLGSVREITLGAIATNTDGAMGLSVGVGGGG